MRLEATSSREGTAPASPLNELSRVTFFKMFSVTCRATGKRQTPNWPAGVGWCKSDPEHTFQMQAVIEDLDETRWRRDRGLDLE